MNNDSHKYLTKGRVIGAWPFMFLFFILCGALTSCHKGESADSARKAQEEADSARLVRPLVIDSALHITNYASQYDADTALLGKRVLGGTTSRSRLLQYRKEGKGRDMEILRSVTEQWSLVVCGSLKARKVKDLQGHTIAIARNDASSILCEQFLREAGVAPTKVFYPQINDLRVRLQMLTNNQVDAAMLPEPYASMAKRQGHRLVKTVTDSTQTVVVARKYLNPEFKQTIVKTILK